MGNGLEGNFRSFFENNIDFLFVLDFEGRIIEVNDAVRRGLGYEDSEIVGRSVLTVHPPEFWEEAGKNVELMLAGKKDSCPVPLLARSGDHIPVETRVFPGTWSGQKVLLGVSRNQTALKESEEKFFSVFERGPYLMAISDPESGAFVNVNRRFCELLGYEEEEIIGRNSFELGLFAKPEERERAAVLLRRGEQVEDFEAEVKTKDGESLTLLFSADHIRVQTRGYLLTSAVDLTQRKKSREKISYLYRQQKLLADISQIFINCGVLDKVMDRVLAILGGHTGLSRVYIFEDSADGATTSNTFEWCNTGIAPQKDELQDFSYEIVPSWKDLLRREGRILADDISKLPDDIFQVLQAQEIKAILVYPLRVEETVYGFIGFDECREQKKWAEEELDLLRTAAGIISEAFGRREALARVEESALRLKMAVESSREGLWDWDNRSGKVYYNEIWHSMLGMGPNKLEPSNESWHRFIHPEDLARVREELGRHLDGKSEVYEAVYRVITRQGEIKWILDHGGVVNRDEYGRPLRTIGTCVDITKQKETEQQLAELISARDKLFSIISHDLRAPLGFFIPALDMLAGDRNLEEETRNRLFKELRSGMENAMNLLENLLSWSKARTAGIELDPVVFDCRDSAREGMDMIAPAAKGKSLALAMESNGDTFVYADKNSISLVVRNLLSNAVKFTPAGGSIRVALNQREEEVEIEVIDTGVGMDQETIDSLFRSDTLVTTRGTDDEKGSGLGLLLCREFIELNNGSMLVRSAPGEGTVFSFVLPKNQRSVLERGAREAMDRG